MAELNGGSRNWPILGENEEDWAPFAFLWPNYVRMDFKNINNGTGNAAEKEIVRKANLHSILALATQKNAQAREIVESRQTPADDGTLPVLDGDAVFDELKAHFEPKLQVHVGLAIKQLDSCFEDIFTTWESDFENSIAKMLETLRKCTYLKCKPDEQQLITKFLQYMPDEGPWGTRKVMWTESTMNADGTFTGVTLKDMINKARVAYTQIKPTNGVKSFAAIKGDGNGCDICGKKHSGECWYRDAHAFAAMNGRGRNGDRKAKVTCYNCGKKGHFARDCKAKKEKDDSDSESELDEATLKKAMKQIKRKGKFKNVTIPGC